MCHVKVYVLSGATSIESYYTCGRDIRLQDYVWLKVDGLIIKLSDKYVANCRQRSLISAVRHLLLLDRSC